MIEWQTGTPKYIGKYLITDKYGHIDVDYWFGKSSKNREGWDRHYEEDVIAWCELASIVPYKNE